MPSLDDLAPFNDPVFAISKFVGVVLVELSDTCVVTKGNFEKSEVKKHFFDLLFGLKSFGDALTELIKRSDTAFDIVGMILVELRKGQVASFVFVFAARVH